MPASHATLPTLRRFAPDLLQAAVDRIFRAAGSAPAEAARIAQNLVASNLRGHDSHGVGSIPVYVRNARSGDLRLNEAPDIIVDSGTMLVVDGRLGAGQVMAHEAMALGIARARQNGSCLVGLRNSHHIGRIGQWAEDCAAAGLVSIHFVNVVSDPAVAPFGGTRPRVGTNPFAVGIPRPGLSPIIVDFATSKLAKGKVRDALEKGKLLPPDALLTSDGQPTRDPAALFTNPQGILLPFGEHKGWCLSVACELLGAALTGGATQSHPKRGNAVVNCMFSIIVSPDHLGTTEGFAQETEKYVSWVRSQENEGVQFPGEPEAHIADERRANGIPLDAQTWSRILEAAKTVGVASSELEAIVEG